MGRRNRIRASSMGHGRIELAAVGVAILVVVGCAPQPEAGRGSSSASTPTSPARLAAPSNSPGVAIASTTTTPSSGGTTIGLTVDPALERLLPEQIPSIRFVRHSLGPGATPPPAFSDDLGRAMLNRVGRSDGDLSVAWIETTPEDVSKSSGLSVVAIRVRGAAGRDLLPLVLADRLLEPGFKGELGMTQLGSGELYAGDTLITSSGDIVFITTIEPEDLTATQAPDPSGPPLWQMQEDLFAALPRFDLSEPPPRRPEPSGGPDASAPPDPDAEALLPSSIGGRPVQSVSGKGPAVLYSYALGLPSAKLWYVLGLDPEGLSSAAGHTNGTSTYLVVVTRLPGLDARTLLGAWFADAQWGNQRNVETIVVAGRVVQLSDTEAVYATDGLLYWMTYLDLGDSTTRTSTPAPRPPLRELVEETIRALP